MSLKPWILSIVQKLCHNLTWFYYVSVFWFQATCAEVFELVGVKGLSIKFWWLLIDIGLGKSELAFFL